MQKSLLAELLKTLNSSEKNAFLRFVESPYHCGKPELLRLAGQLIRPVASSGRLHKTVAFPRVFGPELPFDDARLRKAMEQLLRLLEQFLVSEQFAGEAFEFRLRLAAVFSERRQDKLLRRLIDAPLPLPGRESDWTTLHFDQAARWYQLLYDHRSATRREHDAQLYARVTHCQTVALLATRLRNACIFQSNQKEKTAVPADPLLSWAAPQWAEFNDLPLLRTLFAGLNALQEPANPVHFAVFREGLLGNNTFFSATERRDLLLVAINFCSKRYNDGDRTLLDTQLDLYEYGLREGLLLENGWVSGYTFTNIATLALIAHRYERLAQLLHDYRDKIAPRDRAGAAAFNEARLHYAQGRYPPALALLQQNVFDDLLLNLSAKTVQAKCFYELEEFSLLETHLEALRKFVRRHKEVGYYGERYLNFIAVLRRLMRALPADFSVLEKEIAAMPVLAEKEWLLERVN